MSSPKSYQHSVSISSLIKNRNQSPYMSSTWYGYQVSLITSLSVLLFLELSCLIDTPSTLYSKHSVQITQLLRYLSVLESLIGLAVRTNLKNRLENQDYGKSSETQDTDGSETNCLVENFEQLELDLYPGMP